MSKKKGKCQVAMCGHDSNLIWYGHEICNGCWNKHCDGILCLFDEFEEITLPNKNVEV